MDIVKYLQAQGVGSRKTCRALLAREAVLLDGAPPPAEVDTDAVGTLTVDGIVRPSVPLPYFYIACHKPHNTETSHKPAHYPSVFSLLPDHLRRPDVQAVGRLDADTTGVLILTNDGGFNHRVTAAKNKVPKTYRITLKHAAAEDLCARLCAGVLLRDEAQTVRAHAVEWCDPHTVSMTLSSGKYHQVKRMIAAAGNRVAALHRTRFGRLSADDLPVGGWRYITPEEVW